MKTPENDSSCSYVITTLIGLFAIAIGFLHFYVVNYRTKRDAEVYTARAAMYRVAREANLKIREAYGRNRALVEEIAAQQTQMEESINEALKDLDEAFVDMKEVLDGRKAMESYNDLFRAKFKANCAPGEYTVLHEGFELKVTVWDPMPSREPGVAAVQKWQTRISRTPRQLAAQ